MALKTVGDVVATATWMIHGTNELQVVDILEHTTGILVQEVEAFLVNKLTCDLKSDLISPIVDVRHTHVIKEDCHLFVVWWDENLRLLPFDLSLNRILEVARFSSTGEVDSLEEHNCIVELVCEHNCD